jgi:class 3 adenylate cyclase
MARSDVPKPRFRERKLVLLVIDLAGTSRAVASFDAVRLAEFTSAFFAICGEAVAAHGGRVVKYLGDGCFAVFDEREAVAAVDTALDVRSRLGEFRETFDVDVELGANIHQAVVAEGEFEPDGQYDIMGVGTIHAFRMGAGPGIRISEPVYRQLPNDERSLWTKHKPPAVYTFSER